MPLIPLAPLVCETPFVPLIFETPLVPLVCEIPLVPLVCEVPLMPLVCEIPLVPLACEIPLVPLVCETPLVPLVCAMPLIPFTALGDFALCGRKACCAGHRSKKPAELWSGMYSEPFPYTPIGSIQSDTQEHEDETRVLTHMV